ncbi:MAG: hypothetical protein L6Q95_10275 [Planctomycetes bacterium]|nr:hypothetical protein [Planctomycetota bacterium]
MSAQAVRFELPPGPAGCGPEEFFAGIWWPKGETIAVELPAGVPSVAGSNWVLAGSRSPLSAEKRLLVHRDDRGGIAFRGYIVEPAVHGWCDSGDVLAAWWDRPPDPPNGTFSVARLDDRAGELELVVDTLGIGSLFYRIWGRAVLFATSPRYARLPGDALDGVAWRLRVSGGSVMCDDSLVGGIRRVPAGSRVRFPAEGPPRIECYLPGDLLRPVIRPADRGALERLEAAFARAMRRCCALPGLRPVLPLSAGHDSRRILVALLDLGVPFEAVTMRIPDKRGLDLDARYAAELSARFGFPHRVLDLPTPERYAALDRDRRLLMHGESTHHAWIMPLCSNLPSHPGLILDGLAGDVLAETGYLRPSLVRPDVSEKELCDHLTVRAFEPLFRAPFWPTREKARARLLEWIRTLPRVLLGEWLFLLTRTRREIGAWSQRLVPPGHVVAYPYADLDYVRTALEIDPMAKLRQSLQGRCLAAFHPEFEAIPSNHRVPAGARRSSLARGRILREKARVRTLDSDVSAHTLPERLRDVMPGRHRLLHKAARLSAPVASRIAWWRNLVLEMLVVEQAAQPAWRSADGAAPGANVRSGAAAGRAAYPGSPDLSA